ncbi:glycosyltransferase [Microbacterium testaceum StLB037]|uniref:Glycosyltransferase n=1 Tax=Microbacterium testaceum (strain StLB037) TaxID=979556 RepID=E8NER9_MICTS|nr:glycosyltransferase family 4 protein [Microbacterium testaceum]BAJ75154.1 glycosyltransferase [Microbacterium testaceum StLB037]
MHIVSVTRTVPYDGIPHAGGEYALRHARALTELGHSVTFIAPNTAENRRAVTAGGDGGAALLYGNEEVDTPGKIEGLRRRLSPARLSRRERSAFARDAAVRSALARADVLEFHWTQAGDLTRLAGGHAPRDVRRLLVLHDVMTQQIERQVRSGGGSVPVRVGRAAKLRLVRRAERRAIASVDVAVVFSEKDAQKAETLAPASTRIAVLRPPLATGAHVDDEPGELEPDDIEPSPGFDVLFVGWFRRTDNAQAAEWLCREVWPTVRAARPDARLTLAGADPSPALLEIAASDSSVTVTGYMDSLDAVYRRADLAVVPVQQGAGVKFKTVVAMLWGLPVVSTQVGLEGITADPELVWRAADTANDFAAGVLSAASDPAAARRVGAAARKWAGEEFSEERFRARLHDVLESLRAGPPRAGSPQPPSI